jgi:carbamoyl-phosphate synthase large subunit
MPRRDDIESILIIGSGPIVIGQGCEFDYSGTQAVRVLRDDGYRVILVNSNPATIMTDPEFADATYIEPITPDVVASVIEREHPDAILPTLGGQTALNTAISLVEQGVLDKYGVEMIGATPDAIDAAEDRGRFKQLMDDIGLETTRARYIKSVEEALSAIDYLGYPVMIRPSFILGGGGTGIAHDEQELRRAVKTGLAASPIGEVLIEESILGWKEYELEVMRDHADNAVIVCSIENFDPMGVHTGDSITVAPAMTLSDVEYQEMRDEALACLRAIGVDTGGSNVQFAVDPETGRRIIIEMNPRVSRSSALASKATGFPIAKIAAKLAVGYTLDEITNDITAATPASFEPVLDYVVVKIPRFDFAKFQSVPGVLGTSMQSVGEAMAIGRTFPEALQKAIRSLEIGRGGLNADRGELPLRELTTDDLLTSIRTPTPQRLFEVAELLRRGITPDALRETAIDPWFLDQLADIVAVRAALEASQNAEIAYEARRYGFGAEQLAYLWDATVPEIRARFAEWDIETTFKTVDTCAAEFEAITPYFYSTWEEEDESAPSDNPTVIVLGSGPNRIGQGIEFDYCCVHASLALQETGYDAVMINCNPETVSTDYDTSTRLYFEPLTVDDVLAVIEKEQPEAVIVQLGGQTPLKLANDLAAAGVQIAGTSPDAIDLAEDRKRFSRLCADLDVLQPPNGTATSRKEARSIVAEIGFPVLVRPSYVLGGRAMRIVYTPEELEIYLDEITDTGRDEPIDLATAPLLIDSFLESAIEVDVDAVYDGVDFYIGGVMEHVEEAGVHSGDSACVIPPPTLGPVAYRRIIEYTAALAKGLEVRGLLNIQYAVRGDTVYVLEANPRASRTVPFVSKATGVPLAKIATRVMMGETIEQLKVHGLIPTGSQYDPPYASVKEAVLPWTRFPAEDIILGPEMRSTGEVMGIATATGAAYAKALLGSGARLPETGTLFLSVNDRDKELGVETGRIFSEMGFRIVATSGTAAALASAGVPASHVDKIGEGAWDPIRLLDDGLIDIVINTPRGQRARGDGGLIRRAAIRNRIPCVTTMRGAYSVARSLRSGHDMILDVQPLQEHHQRLRG